MFFGLLGITRRLIFFTKGVSACLLAREPLQQYLQGFVMCHVNKC